MIFPDECFLVKNHIVSNFNITSDPAKTRTVSPFSKLLSSRFAALVKANGTADQNTLYKTAQSAKLHVNGSLINTSSAPAAFSTNTVLRVGNMADFFHFSGSIDDLRIFNSVLSAAEVQAIYNQ